MQCPSCGSHRTWKDGLRYPRKPGSSLGAGSHPTQRYLCRSCGFRFCHSANSQVKLNISSQSPKEPNPGKNLLQPNILQRDRSTEPAVKNLSFKRCENVASQHASEQTIVGKSLNNFADYNRERSPLAGDHPERKNGQRRNRQRPLRTLPREQSTAMAINMAKPEIRQKRAAGATTPDEATVKGKIIEFAWHLKKQGKEESTIKTYTAYIELLNKAGPNIFDPESVKEIIAERFDDRNTKRLATYSYSAFLKFMGLTWIRPKYRQEHKEIFIPTDQELQLAVNYGYKESIAFNQLGYETGARYNEAERLEWTDIDPERRKVTIKASKNGKARILTVSQQLIDRLMSLPHLSKTVFPPRNKNTRRVSFRRKMKTLARIHDNPRFLKIRYHTFRHCKALREYHKTHNILHVKKVLGHRSIMTTQRYVELYTEIYGDFHPQDYVCETASTVEKAKKLVEKGFEYVSTINGEQLYRKVKNV